ncbi:peptide-N4-(N-acetyl-beta-glucosaminyl)asparagine amidase A [Xylariomycetidae sp. FL0641]|nr:peptide-N4-(N-acetyl-beta-glucosaminyl)asparagine amidase A [Xylariomycetidae sp. FL0641]
MVSEEPKKRDTLVVAQRSQIHPRRTSTRHSGTGLLVLLLLALWTWARFAGLRPSLFERANSLDIFRTHDESNGTIVVTSLPTPTPSVLECFEVTQPVLLPDGPTHDPDGEVPSIAISKENCSVLLMEHVFGLSYGKPFVGNYTPPSCAFNRVIINFTAVSQGRQFDRLAFMYLGDTEVWRTSTAEPTSPPGIRWTFLKDMTAYLYLWKSPQTLIFDLGNLLDEKYTGSFNTTLTATFFMSDVETDAARPADLIVPISSRQAASSRPSHFILPADDATNSFKLPRNVNRAVFSISANGQANEEFWWSNVLDDDVDAFRRTAGNLPGLSPFREVQVLIDGQLVGVQWPFPVVFTGGVVPSLHRPIVGLQAFDLKEHQIDISPWLPVLCDGAEHTFTIKVAGLANMGTSTTSLTNVANDSWYVTGKVFAWLDDEGAVTTGSPPEIDLSDPVVTYSRHLAQNETGFNESLTFDLSVQRIVSIRSNVTSQKTRGESLWSQTLSYTNAAAVLDFGFIQTNDLDIRGVDLATAPNVFYKSAYGYPLFCNQTLKMSPKGDLFLIADLNQGIDLQLYVFAGENTAFSGSYLRTTRDGQASFYQSADRKNSVGFGTTNQVFEFGGLIGAGEAVVGERELYFRDVTAINGSVTHNEERLAGDGHKRGASPRDTSTGSRPCR